MLAALGLKLSFPYRPGFLAARHSLTCSLPSKVPLFGDLQFQPGLTKSLCQLWQFPPGWLFLLPSFLPQGWSASHPVFRVYLT